MFVPPQYVSLNFVIVPAPSVPDCPTLSADSTFRRKQLPVSTHSRQTIYGPIYLALLFFTPPPSREENKKEEKNQENAFADLLALETFDRLRVRSTNRAVLSNGGCSLVHRIIGVCVCNVCTYPYYRKMESLL